MPLAGPPIEETAFSEVNAPFPVYAASVMTKDGESFSPCCVVKLSASAYAWQDVNEKQHVRMELFCFSHNMVLVQG